MGKSKYVSLTFLTRKKLSSRIPLIRIRTSPPSGQPWKRRSTGKMALSRGLGRQAPAERLPRHAWEAKPGTRTAGQCDTHSRPWRIGGGQAWGEGRSAALSGSRGPHPTWMDGRGSTSTQEGTPSTTDSLLVPFTPLGLFFSVQTGSLPKCPPFSRRAGIQGDEFAWKPLLRVLGWVARALSARDARTGLGAARRQSPSAEPVSAKAAWAGTYFSEKFQCS